MPQMAPMSWLSLFIYFSIIFFLFSNMNYFSFLPTSNKLKKEEKELKTNSMNWKW
uniref:ATP synthase complex subunit 8 n=1 Tax=Trichopsidea sp. TaxID=2885618 RepID=A0A8K1NV87_9MUSC|nr:ATP synthase F0 subunit 8 [Trichopsidea sp.]